MISISIDSDLSRDNKYIGSVHSDSIQGTGEGREGDFVVVEKKRGAGAPLKTPLNKITLTTGQRKESNFTPIF